eukprot:scaffold47933_cov64-Phaeocystis_antarctica.AAC.3
MSCADTGHRTHPCYYHRTTTSAPPRLPAPPHRARPFRSTQNWPRNSPKVRYYDAQELPLTQSGLKGWSGPLCPVGCGALVVSCPRRIRSDTSNRCLAHLRGPFSSRSTTAKAK